MKQISIYKIICLENKKIYIGSSINTKKRWTHHKNDLRRNKHHSKHLQRAWNKYGSENFLFEIIEETTLENLLIREDYWLDLLKPWKRNIGFNFYRKATSTSGRKITKATRRKMRDSQLGKKRDPESVKKAIDQIRGSKSHWAKLNEDQIIDIRKKLLSGSRQSSLARLFGITRSTMCDIAHYRIWKHVQL